MSEQGGTHRREDLEEALERSEEPALRAREESLRVFRRGSTTLARCEFGEGSFEDGGEDGEVVGLVALGVVVDDCGVGVGLLPEA